MKLIKSILVLLFCLTGFAATGADEASLRVDNRYLGIWKGAWLEGMSSGKIQLEIKESTGHLTFTALPSFGAEAAILSKLGGTQQRLGFQTSGADGRVMRFNLSPSADFSKLKGKAHYDSLHMELELSRAQ